MQASARFAIVAVALLTACSDTSGILGTDVGRQMANTNATTPELILREAVFLNVNGQSAQEAAETLKDDGAICTDSVCRWSFIHRETWFDTWGVRMPGPRRTTRRIWTVIFLNDQILNQSDIDTNVNFQSETAQ